VSRVASPVTVFFAAMVLTACAAPALLLPNSGQLMMALLQPLVGLDPNVHNLWEQPLIKRRMTTLLGERYDTVLGLLKTADSLRQEGPLFFIVSRFSPLPEIAQDAGLVWNSERNQMAALIREKGALNAFVESTQRAVIEDASGALQQKAGPVWPAVMQTWIDAVGPLQAITRPAPSD
jgi:hypothetical protein